MPKANTGPFLDLRRRSGNKRHLWYIVWYERGREHVKSTGAGSGERAQAEAIFGEWLRERTEAQLSAERAALATESPRTKGPRDPDQVPIADVLALYGQEIGDQAVDGERIGDAIDALLTYWGDMMVGEIVGATCRAYCVHRRQNERVINAATPDERIIPPVTSNWTLRRELGTLRAAVRYALAEGQLTRSPVVTLPKAPPPADVWIETREDAARLIRAARNIARKTEWAEKLRSKGKVVHSHLALFILIGLYTGARHEAILSLQWMPNTEGGHVDLERGRIQFNAMGRHQTAKLRPEIPIPTKLRPFLERARKRTRRHVIEWLGSGVQSVRRSFARAVREAGLPPSITPHKLRHTCMTWLYEAGESKREVQQFVGCSEATAERIYVHVSPHYLEKVKDGLRRPHRRSA